MTRRHFLTTAVRAVLLATLLPFLPKAEAKPKADLKLDFPHMTAWIKMDKWGVTPDGNFIAYDQSGNGNHMYGDGPPVAYLKIIDHRVYADAHDRARREREVREMEAEARGQGEGTAG